MKKEDGLLPLLSMNGLIPLKLNESTISFLYFYLTHIYIYESHKKAKQNRKMFCIRETVDMYSWQPDKKFWDGDIRTLLFWGDKNS